MVRTVIIVVAESWWCCSYCSSSNYLKTLTFGYDRR
jgi:hypothetical protein